MKERLETIIYEADDYISEYDKSIDVLEIIFDSVKWNLVTQYLTKHKVKFWIEQYEFYNIEEFLYRGYCHLYMLTSTVPNGLLAKHPPIKGYGNIRNALTKVRHDIKPEDRLTDTQVKIYRDIIYPSNEQLLELIAWEEFLKVQLNLPFV